MINKLSTPVAILIAGIIFGGFLFLSQKNNQEFAADNFLQKERCEERGRARYEYEVKEAISGAVISNPEYHYSKKLNTCLYYSTYTNSNYWEYSVEDILSNKEIVQFRTTLIGDGIVHECSWCVSSIEEFNKKKLELFNN